MSVSGGNKVAVSGPVLGLGVVLILAGFGLLIFTGVSAYTALTAPGDVKIIQFVLAHVGISDRAFYGTITDPNTGQNVNFELNWSESVRTISMLFMGIVLLGVVAGISRAILASGAALVGAAVRMRGDEKGPKRDAL